MLLVHCMMITKLAHSHNNTSELIAKKNFFKLHLQADNQECFAQSIVLVWLNCQEVLHHC